MAVKAYEHDGLIVVEERCEGCGRTRSYTLDPTYYGFGKIRDYRTSEAERRRRSERLKALRAAGKAGRGCRS